jgi:type IV secretion system protein VirD4
MKLPDVFIRQKLGRYAAVGAEENKEINSMVSTADTQSAFIGNEAMAASLKGDADPIDMRHLKTKRGTVFCICLPLDKMDVGSKWYRIVNSGMISATLSEGLNGNGGAEVVAVLDEAYQAGYLKVMADAWGMAAGATSLRMWGVWQDISQISTQFRGAHGTIVQNSGTAIYFGIRDQQTAEFVSKQCGVTEVLSRSRSVSLDRRTRMPIVNDSVAQTARPLLHPDEVRFGLGSEDALLFADGLPGVCAMRRKRYIDCTDLKGKYRENPYFRQGRNSANKQTPGLWGWLFGK